MKKYFRNLVTILGFALFVFSCNSEQELPVSLQEENEPENISEIALLEEELGITLFKRDFILTDESNDNQVILRVAGVEEDILESYLNSVTFSMNPVYLNDYPFLVRESKEEFVLPEERQTDQDFSGIITEFVSQTLKDDVIGIRLNVAVREGNENSRINYNFTATHTSDVWPYLATVQTYANSLEIKYHFDAKERWYKSWYTGYLETCKYNGNAAPDLSQCSHWWTQPANSSNTFWVDGPYKSRVNVSYWNSGSYSVTYVY